MTNKVVVKYFADLNNDLRHYRTRMKQIFSRKLTRPRDCSSYFFDILVSTSGLYRDHLTLRMLEAQIYREDTKPRNRRITPRKFKPRVGLTKEVAMRPKFRTRIESLNCLARFQPESEFAEENHLRAHEDYIYNLALHLPEIYGETFNVEECVKRFRKKKDFSAVTELAVGLEHIAHHVSYCHYALETLSDAWRWR